MRKWILNLCMIVIMGLSYAEDTFQIPTAVCRAWNVILAGIFVGAIIFLGYGIFLHTTSGTDEMQANRGKNMIVKSLAAGIMIPVCLEILFYLFNQGRLCGL